MQIRFPIYVTTGAVSTLLLQQMPSLAGVSPTSTDAYDAILPYYTVVVDVVATVIAIVAFAGALVAASTAIISARPRMSFVRPLLFSGANVVLILLSTIVLNGLPFYLTCVLIFSIALFITLILYTITTSAI